MRDQVYRHPQSQIVDFAFDKDVVQVFPDMIRRSVPGYETIIPMGGLIAARHLGEQGLAFDLGCSLGASSLAVLKQNSSPDIRVVAVDSSQAMIDQARANITDPRLALRCADLLSTSVAGANVVMMNFVLQFLEPQQRQPLLNRLAAEMAPQGLLILSEKIYQTDESLQEFFDSNHLAWKRANGYSELEVSQKRQSLENVMRLDTEAIQLQRLKNAGFAQVTPWFRCLNWVSFIAQR